MVVLDEILTAGLVKTLSNFAFFYYLEGKITFPYFLKADHENIIRLKIKINPYDFEELVG